MNQPGQIVIVMGVSGCGKSTVAQHLASLLQADFLDGDTLHPPGNIQKMSSGVPLTDNDRAPWLAAVRDETTRRASEHGINVTACSALKARYRDILREAGDVAFVHLDGSRELIGQRMHLRHGHFMPESLLDTQFAALEHPGAEPQVYLVGIEPAPEQVAKNAALALNDFIDRPASTTSTNND